MKDWHKWQLVPLLAAVALVSLGFFLARESVQGGGTGVTVRAGSAAVAPGDSVTVDVDALNVTAGPPDGPLSAFTIEVKYNTSLLTGVSCIPNHDSVFAFGSCSPTFAAGVARCTGISIAGASGAELGLCTITFRAASVQVKTRTPLDVNCVVLTDPIGTSIPCNTQNGEITIQPGATDTPTPTRTRPTDTPTATPTGVVGKVTVRAGSAAVASGDPVTVEVDALNVSAGRPLSAFTIEVKYNTSLLTGTSCTPNHDSVFAFGSCSPTFAAGVARCTGVSIAGASGAELGLCTITFRAASVQVKTRTPLDVNCNTTTDPNGAGIPCNTRNGEIAIQPETPTPTPTATGVPTCPIVPDLPFPDPGCDSFQSTASVDVNIDNPPLGSLDCLLQGPTIITRGPVVSKPPDSIDTEIVFMNLKGSCQPGSVPVTLRESPTVDSLGRIDEQKDNAAGTLEFPADSFFDVFFEVDTPVGTLHNQDPLTMSCKINLIPPLGCNYLPEVPRLSLFDASGKLVGTLKHAEHLPLPKVTVRAGSGSVEPGGQITIAVDALLNPPAINQGAFTVEVKYNTSLLTGVDCTPNPAGIFDFGGCNAASSPGIASCTGISASGASGAELSLCDLTFQAAQVDVKTRTPLDVNCVVKTDPDGDPILCNPDDGEITIQPATPTPTPTVIRPTDTPTPPPGPKVLVRVGDGVSGPGGSVTVDVEVLGVPAPGLGAATVDVQYDPAPPAPVLDATACNADPAGIFNLANCNPTFDNDNTAPDTARCVAIDVAGETGNLVLCTVTFNVVDCTPGSMIPLTKLAVTLADSTGSEYQANTEAGEILCGRQGDVDCDGDADAVDSLFVLQNVLGLRGKSDQCPPPPNTLFRPAGDVDKDGDMDAVDSLFLLQCVLGLKPGANMAFCT